MQIGVVGLGRMGSNIAARLARFGHSVVGYDRTPSAIEKLRARHKEAAIKPAHSLSELVSSLSEDERRVVWVMLPAGEITSSVIEELKGLLSAGDIIIDGGNTYYKDDVRRSKELAKQKISYVDVGTSGGIWGYERGYCMMIGGTKKDVTYLDPIFKVLAPGVGDIAPSVGRKAPEHSPSAEQGYLHCGPSGAGHFVKMVHNGIEYGMMQAYAEGFDILCSKNSKHLPADERYDLNLADIAELWRRGSVVTSWLLDLKAQALAKSSKLEEFKGEVADSGEGRWTIEAAIEENVPVPVMTAALFTRFRSRSGNNFAEKSLSAMRFGFGGHIEGGLPANVTASERTSWLSKLSKIYRR